MRDSDDVYDVEDIQSLWRSIGGRLSPDNAAVAVALAVVGICLAFALVLHVFGAVGGMPVDTNQGPTPASSAEPDAQQRFQNYLTFISFTFAPLFLPLVAVGIAFAAVLRTEGRRLTRVGGVTGGAAAGMAIGYGIYVVVAHLAYGEAEQGFYVESLPVSVRFEVLASNALALAAVVAVGSVIAGYAGTLLQRDVRAGQESPGSAAEAVDGETTADGSAESTADSGALEAAGSDEDDAEDRDGAPSNEGDEGDDADRDGGRSGDRPAPTRVGDTGPASDYQDQGPPRGGQPHYDPNERNWDGRGDDGEEPS